MVSDTTLPIALQTSAMGLPAGVVPPLVRAAVRLFCAVSTHEMALGLFRREARLVVALLEDLPVRQGGVRVLTDSMPGLDGRYWSAFMVAEYLGHLVDEVRGILEDLGAGRPPGGKAFMADHRPRVGAGLEAVRRFIAAVMGFEAAAEQLGPFDRRVKHAHPRFGLLCAHGWHCFAALSLYLNRKQIERIVKRLEARTEE